MTRSKIMAIREALRAAGLDYVITHTDGNVAHVKIYVGDDDGS